MTLDDNRGGLEMDGIAGVSVTGIGGLPNWKHLVKAVAWLGPWQHRIIHSFHHHTVVTEAVGFGKFHHTYYEGEEVTCVTNSSGTPDKQFP